MSQAPQGPGWWQASDGHWYPPAHESAPPAAPPQPAPPPFVGPPIAPRTPPWAEFPSHSPAGTEQKRRPWTVWVGAAVLVAAGLTVVAALAWRNTGGDSGPAADAPSSDLPPANADAVPPTPAPTPDVPGSEAPEPSSPPATEASSAVAAPPIAAPSPAGNSTGNGRTTQCEVEKATAITAIAAARVSNEIAPGEYPDLYLDPSQTRIYYVIEGGSDPTMAAAWRPVALPGAPC